MQVFRTFGTVYDPGGDNDNGSAYKWGYRDMKRLERLHKHANKLEERIQKSLITKTNFKANITYTSNKITAKNKEFS